MEKRSWRNIEQSLRFRLRKDPWSATHMLNFCTVYLQRLKDNVHSMYPYSLIRILLVTCSCSPCGNKTLRFTFFNLRLLFLALSFLLIFFASFAHHLLLIYTLEMLLFALGHYEIAVETLYMYFSSFLLWNWNTCILYTYMLLQFVCIFTRVYNVINLV